MYEFVQKLVKKKKPGWDFNPGPIWLAIVTVGGAWEREERVREDVYPSFRGVE